MYHPDAKVQIDLTNEEFINEIDSINTIVKDIQENGYDEETRIKKLSKILEHTVYLRTMQML